MWWSRYQKLVFEFKPFTDETGEIQKEIRGRINVATRGRADMGFDFENGRLTVWGLRPSGTSVILARLPPCIRYEFCDMTHEYAFQRKEMVEDNTMSAFDAIKDTAPSKKNDVVVIFKSAMIALLTTATIIGAIGIAL